jgi:hypothetical protein
LVWYYKLSPNQIESEYPSAYYKITNNKTIPIRGTYVDMVKIKGKRSP